MDHDGGHGVIELGAALILVVGGALLTTLSIRTRQARPSLAASRPSGSRPRPGPGEAPVGRPALAVQTAEPSLVAILAALSLGAAAIHLVAAPSHFVEIGDLAIGFMLAAGFQGAWARWCLTGPSERIVALGIAGNLAILAAWAWSRTIGLPLSGGLTQEGVGLPDGAAVAFELVLVAGLIGLAAGRRVTGRMTALRPVARSVGAIAVVPVVGLVLILTSLATIAIAAGLDHGLPSVPPGASSGMDHGARH